MNHLFTDTTSNWPGDNPFQALTWFLITPRTSLGGYFGSVTLAISYSSLLLVRLNYLILNWCTQFLQRFLLAMHFCSFSEKILKRVKVMGLKVGHHLRARIYYCEGLLEKYPPPKKERMWVHYHINWNPKKEYQNFPFDSHLFLVSKGAKAANTDVFVSRHQVFQKRY